MAPLLTFQGLTTFYVWFWKAWKVLFVVCLARGYHCSCLHAAFPVTVSPPSFLPLQQIRCPKTAPCVTHPLLANRPVPPVWQQKPKLHILTKETNSSYSDPTCILTLKWKNSGKATVRDTHQKHDLLFLRFLPLPARPSLHSSDQTFKASVCFPWMTQEPLVLEIPEIERGTWKNLIFIWGSHLIALRILSWWDSNCGDAVAQWWECSGGDRTGAGYV